MKNYFVHILPLIFSQLFSIIYEKIFLSLPPKHEKYYFTGLHCEFISCKCLSTEKVQFFLPTSKLS